MWSNSTTFFRWRRTRSLRRLQTFIISSSSIFVSVMMFSSSVMNLLPSIRTIVSKPLGHISAISRPLVGKSSNPDPADPVVCGIHFGFKHPLYLRSFQTVFQNPYCFSYQKLSHSFGWVVETKSNAIGHMLGHMGLLVLVWRFVFDWVAMKAQQRE